MSRTHLQHRRRLALALVLAAAVVPAGAPAASAKPTDQPAPRAIYAPVPQQQDLRSPRARDAGLDSLRQEQAATQAAARDLRSPDTRDVAAARPVSGPGVNRVAEPSAFEWGDAGIGAGAALALAMIASGGVLLTTRRRAAAN
jgi:hypothetical protein